MAGDLPEVLLGSVDESRRTFLRKLILSTAFVAPGVASFTMGGLGIGEAMANVSNLSCFVSNLTIAPGETTIYTIGDIVGNYNNLDFTERNLSGYNLVGDSFVGTDFAGANLYHAIFGCDNCANANFFKACLQGADLEGANLAGANFAQADLSGANLSGANLSNANLAGANVTGAYLAGANMAGTNIRGAYGKLATGVL